MFVFEEGKPVVFINRHLEWCKGTLARDYPEARVATIKMNDGGFYSIVYDDIREYISAQDKRDLLARRRAREKESKEFKENNKGDREPRHSRRRAAARTSSCLHARDGCSKSCKSKE